jgi:PAS domain S-box-containing protein
MREILTSPKPHHGGRPPRREMAAAWCTAAAIGLLLAGARPAEADVGKAFLPHAVCYLWDTSLLALHAVTDALIGGSYVAISATLGYLVYRARRDVPFHWVILAFGLFIVACGMTHFIELWTLWSPRYWLAGNVKAVTALASLATALVLPPLVPHALALIQAAKLSDERQRGLEKAHADLEAAHGRVKDLDRLKTQFFANVSHELRTPLALILGPVEHLLQAPDLAGDARRHLSVVQQNALLLLRHVNDLLDVSKLEAGKMGLAYRHLDLAALVRLTAGHFVALAAERRMQYRVDTPEVLQAQVDGDKVQRVLLNLLSNAFKFTPDGGSIHCVLTPDGRLVIDDSGPGIAPAMRQAIFDRFRQGEAGPTRRFGGTGLGLAIARDFVELHAGSIDVGDSPLSGARFTVRLPLTAPAGAMVQVAPGFTGQPELAEQVLADVRSQPSMAWAAERPGPGDADRGPAGERPVVLVVEDNVEMNRFLVGLLRPRYEVVAAFNGAEALARLTALKPDLVLTDVMMPGMSGDDLVRLIRQRPELEATPVMLVTAKADDDLRATLLREGAQDYVTKPFAADEVLARVANLVALKRARDVLREELTSQTADVATLAREVAARSRELREAEATAREQREWLRVTLTSIGDAVIVTDPGGRVTFMNPVAEAVTGWRAAEAAGQALDQVFRIVNEASGETVESPVTKVVREGIVVGLVNHTVLLARDGRRVPIDDSGAPIRDDAGRLVGVVLVFRDVTERRRHEAERSEMLERESQARAEAEAAQRRLELLADASALLASSLDYETTLKSVARLAVPALADWCAVDMLADDGQPTRLAVIHADAAKEPLARELQERYAPRADAPHGISRVLATGQSEFQPVVDHAEFMGMARDDRHAALVRELGLGSFLCVPIAAGGAVRGAMSFVRRQGGRSFIPDDLALAEALARRAALAIENARLYREAEIANRTKDEFLATLSHELRTPLNAMLGWATMLRGGTLDTATTARAVDAIERNTRVHVQLIDDLLDVSRIISGKLRLDIQPVNLAAIIEAALEATRPAADARDIHVTVHVTPQVGPVPGDADRLQQVVWNLVSNAIKFTPKGGHVTVTLDAVDSRARLRVRDTGIGIEPTFLPYIFDRFRQAEAPTTRTQRGLGLGLAIVKHIVDLHGGTVRADSEGEGRGAAFTVELPVRVTAERPGNGERKPLAPAAATPFQAPPILDGLRVLVVDDDADARDLLTTILGQCRAQVTAVGTTPEALAALDTQPFDLLVSDIGLPGEDGYALIRRVRAQEVQRGGRLPAVALTAYARSEDRRLALLAGFQMHVAKPIQPGELLAVVASVAAMRRS